MLTINTNLSSLIAQGNLHQSTNKLNQAIERMTTGYKINHASDNAANYSIATNMDTKIGAYMVAEENASMGLDLLMTAEGSLNLISDKLSRLRSLAVTAQNGTYGASSISALESEAEALISEIKREYATTEYNGVKLFNQQSGGSSAAAPETPATFSLARTISFDGLERVSEADSIEANKSYRIDDATDLVALQNFVNGGGDTTNVTFELTDDIDMNGIEFGFIGDYDSPFTGIFNGNGHVIEKIRFMGHCAGLFGNTEAAVIDSLGIVDYYSSEYYTGYFGALVADAESTSISNCYSIGLVEKGTEAVGGLVGNLKNSIVENCYSISSLCGLSSLYSTGGLIGEALGTSVIKNCYSSGSVEVWGCGGGLIGNASDSVKIVDSYSSSTVTLNSVNQLEDPCIGGLIGFVNNSASIKGCYSIGTASLSVGAMGEVGGFIGHNVTGSSLTDNYYNQDSHSVAVGNGSFSGVDGKSIEEIKVLCTPEAMGFTEDNGWVIVDGMPRLAWEVANNPSEDEDLSGSVRPAGYVGLHIGIGGGNSSTISFNVDFELSGIDDILTNGLADENCLTTIDNMLKTVSNKATEYGAMQNRLMSVLEEISVQYDNLVSACSTIKDADMAEISSQYIQQQILQEASATLLATANQTPALALQLL